MSRLTLSLDRVRHVRSFFNERLYFALGSFAALGLTLLVTAVFFRERFVTIVIDGLLSGSSH